MKLEISELQDFAGSLKELHQIIERLIDAYGDDIDIYFDAGYNNVSVYLTTNEI